MPIIGGSIGAVAKPAAAGATSGGGDVSGISLSFTTLSGTSFILAHNLDSINLTWQMYRTTPSPIQSVIPDNITVLDPNHIRVDLQTPMDGVINLIKI